MLVHLESLYCKVRKLIIKLKLCVFFLRFCLQPTDESENGGLNNSIEEESLKGKEKRKNENVNGKTEEQPAKKRKEDPGSHFETKKPSPTRNKVANFVA